MGDKYIYVFLFCILILPLISANLEVGISDETNGIGINFGPIEEGTTLTGNFTNLSQLLDTNIPAPNDDDVLTWDDTAKRWIAQAVGAISKWIVDVSGGYLYNNSNTLFFNETKLNETIDLRLTGGLDGNASSICDGAEVLLGNKTCSNSSRFLVDEDTWILNYTAYDNKTIINKNLSLYALNTSTSIQHLINGTSILFNKIFSTDWSNISNIDYVRNSSSAVQSLINGSNILFDKIFAKDWSNVTGSQINNNLNWINTTNGTSIDIINLYANFYNWTTNDSMLDFDGSTLGLDRVEFNSSVEQITASITYNATQIVTESGNLDSGNLASIQKLEDGDTYNVSEIGGADPLTININFSNVENFNNIILSEYYMGGSGHEIEIQLKNYNSSLWELKHVITDMTGFAQTILPVFDPSNHIDGSGNVSLRFIHIQNGNPAHDLFIDYIVLLDGFSTTTIHEHDALGGRDDPNNHPWALPKSGGTITGNLTLNYIFPTIINWTSNIVNETQFDFSNLILTIKESWLRTFVQENSINQTELSSQVYNKSEVYNKSQMDDNLSLKRDETNHTFSQQIGAMAGMSVIGTATITGLIGGCSNIDGLYCERGCDTSSSSTDTGNECCDLFFTDCKDVSTGSGDYALFTCSTDMTQFIPYLTALCF